MKRIEEQAKRLDLEYQGIAQLFDQFCQQAGSQSSITSSIGPTLKTRRPSAGPSPCWENPVSCGCAAYRENAAP